MKYQENSLSLLGKGKVWRENLKRRHRDEGRRMRNFSGGVIPLGVARVSRGGPGVNPDGEEMSGCSKKKTASTVYRVHTVFGRPTKGREWGAGQQ